MEMDVWFEIDNDAMNTWEGGNWAKDVVGGKLPKKRSPFFPLGHKAHSLVSELYNSGKYETGEYSMLQKFVIVPKSEIITILKKLYCGLDHINKQLDELLAFVDTLPDDKMYRLVQDEF